MIEERLVAWLRDGLAAAAPGLGLDGDLPEPELLEPKQKGHGDFATNVALALAGRIGRPPREVAEAIVDAAPSRRRSSSARRSPGRGSSTSSSPTSGCTTRSAR